MTVAERNNKLKHYIACLKCEVSGKCCDDNCSIQYDAGNMSEIIENLEAISKVIEQETVLKEVYDHEYFLRKEFEIKIDKSQRQLDKIRTEIEKLPIAFTSSFEMKQDCLDIIDKYKTEREDKNEPG